MKNPAPSLRCLVTAFLFLLPFSSPAQSAGWARYYTGTWGSKPVTLQLNFINSTFTGEVLMAGCDGGCTVSLVAGQTEPPVLEIMNQSSEVVAHWTAKIAEDGSITGGNNQGSLSLQPDCSKGSLQFKMVETDQSQPLKGVTGKEVPEAHFGFHFLEPVQARTEAALQWAAEEVKYAIFDGASSLGTPAQIIEGMARDRFTDYQTLAEQYDSSEGSWFYNWEEEVWTRIVLNENDLLTYGIDYSDYTGGVHGSYLGSFLLLDLKGQKVLEYGDIFNDNERTEAALSKLLEAQFKKDLAEQGNEIQSLDEVLFDNELKPNRNLFITRDGIGFFYNHYEITAYAFGHVEVFLDWASIEKLILRDSPVRRLMGR